VAAPLPNVGDLRREDLVLHRAAAHLSPLTVADAANGAGDGLVEALKQLGWSPSTGDATSALVVGSVAHNASLLDAIGAHSPAVVAALEETAPVAWPGWDGAVLRLGYEPCQYTGTWRIYVATAGAATLGPLLAAPVQQEELRAAGVQSYADLEEEVEVWRNAAVDGWALRLEAEQLVRSPDEVTVEHLQAHIAAMQATLSWRVTAPLRAVQRRRLARAPR